MLTWRSNLRDPPSATKIYTPHVFRGTCQMAMRATTSGTSTGTPGLISDADLLGPHNNGNVMIPVVGEAACATGPSAYTVSWATVRWWSERWGGEKKKRRREMGGRVLLYPQPTCLPNVCQVPRTFPVNVNVTCIVPYLFAFFVYTRSFARHYRFPT